MSDRARRFHSPIVGACAGLAVGDLLLGLNPERLGFLSIVRLLGGCAAAGALVAAPFALLRRRGSGTGLVAIALVSALLAALVESEREVYYLFLKNGTRRVLVMTTLVLSAFAVAALAVRLLGRARRAGARALAVAAALLTLPPLVGRRAVDTAGLASPAPFPRAPTKSLLVVGFDGLSWEALSAFSSEGALPVFARLLATGAAGPLAPVAPYDRAAVWTTAATGKRPAKHGVVSHTLFATPLGALRLLPRIPGAPALRPSLLSPTESAPPRRSLAFWEVLATRRHQATLLAWPYADPAKEGLVLWAAERLFDGDDSPDAARPAEAAARARVLRVPVANLDQPLVKELAPAALEARERVAVLQGASRDLSVVGAALAAVPQGPVNVSAFVLSGAATSAPFLLPGAQPSRAWGLPVRHADAKARALRAYYKFLDDTLSDLLAREGQDRTLCLFAPSGWGAPPPLQALVRFLQGKEPVASPEASLDGFVLLVGPGIRAGVRLTSATVADLAPTLLVLAGEPVARDMDGRVLSEAFDERFAESASVPIVTTFEPDGPQ